MRSDGGGGPPHDEADWTNLVESLVDSCIEVTSDRLASAMDSGKGRMRFLPQSAVVRCVMGGSGCCCSCGLTWHGGTGVGVVSWIRRHFRYMVQIIRLWL